MVKHNFLFCWFLPDNLIKRIEFSGKNHFLVSEEKYIRTVLESEISEIMFQLNALVKKNFLEKRRNPTSSCCEFFSHFIILTLLVAAFGLSKIVYFPSKQYNKISINIPPAFIDSSLIINASDIQSQKFDEYVDYTNLLTSFNDLFGQPLPIPSFDTYFYLAQAFSSALGDQKYNSIINSLPEGRALGNLLDLGTIHFAPYPSVLVDSYIEYMMNSTINFRNMTIYKHSSEDSAVQYILDNDYERTFVLIVFREISVNKINYVIRQNYSTLPNTNTVVDTVLGVNTEFQDYFLSGFLTMQDSIDRWALHFTNSTPFVPQPNSIFSTLSILSLEELLKIFNITIPLPFINDINIGDISGLLSGISNFPSISGLNNQYETTFNEFKKSLKAKETENNYFNQQSSTPRPDVCLIYPSQFSFPYPTYKYSQNPFYVSVGSLLGLALAMSILYPMSKLVKQIVEEKELKLREVLVIMGLRESVYTLAIYITGGFTFFFIALTVTLYSGGTFLPKSDKGLLFLFFLSFYLSLVPLSILVSVFFSNSKLASIFGPVILLFLVLPKFIFFTTTNQENVQLKTLVSVLSPTSFSFGLDIISNFEYIEYGAQWSNIWDDGYNLGTSIIMMLFDFILYGALAWYLDKVYFRQYGVRKHPLFCLQPSYWISSWRAFWGLSPSKSLLPENDETFERTGNNGMDTMNESLSPSQISDITVNIQNLRKVYSDGKIAVQDLSLQLVNGQITCLLGHNGAGKSTTISLLTGLVEPSSGDCEIFGHSILTDMDSIRHLTGICPQQNVLFDSLTVREHLMLVGSIKGLRFSALKNAVKELIEDVGLKEKTHVLSRALSGGMKRKLCLAMAFIGDSKFVLLDEPTSGMDPYSRRAIWDVLQRRRAGRVVLLTTHYLDEADIVSDRVIILSEGRLRCSGTSLFLKNRFGAGYVLSISKLDNSSDEEILEGVKSIVDSAQLSSSRLEELIINLPLQSAPSLSSLFAYLKSDSQRLGLLSFGISIKSLEQVFISLAREDKKDETSFVQSTEESGGMIKQFQKRTINLVNQIIPWKSHSKANVDMELSSFYVNENPQLNQGQFKETSPIYEENVENNEKSQSYSNSEIVPFSNKSNQSNINAAEAVILDENEKNIEMRDFRSGENRNQCGDESNEDIKSPGGSWFVQFKELLRKRYLVVLRDRKGFFFQILFPALQILAVMALLTVVINPAGHTLRLLTSSFPFTPAAQAAGSTSLVRDSLATSRMTLTQFPNIHNSSNMSNYLLDSYMEDHQDRYGSFVFNDTIPFEFSINYDWVKKQLNAFFSSEEGLASFFPIPGRSFQIGQDSVVDNLGINMTEVKRILSGLNLSSSLINNITSFLETNVTATLSFDEIDYYPVPRIIEFVDIKVSSVDQTIDIGNVNISIINITSNLPTGTEYINYDIKSPYTVLHNTTSPHGVAIFMAEMKAAFFQTCSPAVLEDPDGEAKFVAKNHPLPLTARQTLNNQIILAFLTSLFILVPLCYIPAAFMAFIVRERASKSKHIQMVSSVDPWMYWCSTYAWDMLLFLLLDLFVLIVFAGYGTDAAKVFIGNTASGGAVFLLLLSYGLSVTPLNYIYSMFFDNHSTCQITVTVVNFFTGFIFVLAYFIMINVPQTAASARIFVHLFRIFPCYNIGEGLIAVTTANYENDLLNANRDVFSFPYAGRNIIFMFVEAIGYFGIVLLTETSGVRIFRRWIDQKRIMWHSGNKIILEAENTKNLDEDVAAEVGKVEGLTNRSEDDSNESLSYSILLRALNKVYSPTVFGGSPKHAVRNMSLALRTGERFGLLGINGAGKSTTMAILTSDTEASSGSVTVGGFDISDHKTLSLIGFCPQTDPLIDLLTGYETLWFFGRIRGVPVDLLGPRIQKLIKETGLSKHAHRTCGNYSGGNKRKLSLAIALIGNPDVLLLDEPSSGMDPEARRDMWDVINNVSKNRTVVLTTHSMEEAEAVCSRIGIMVQGNLRCLGTSQHLKSKFSQGYETQINCVRNSSDDVTERFMEMFPHSTIKEKHGDFVSIRTPRVTQNNEENAKEMDLSQVFSYLEQEKSGGKVLDYAVSQTTLEQVFVDFAEENAKHIQNQ